MTNKRDLNIGYYFEIDYSYKTLDLTISQHANIIIIINIKFTGYRYQLSTKEITMNFIT